MALAGWNPQGPRWVVLTGAECAGKSEVLAAISAMFGGRVVRVPEAARTLIDEGVLQRFGGKLPPEWRAWFQAEVLKRHLAEEERAHRLAAQHGAELVLLDRGLLDGAAFWPGGWQVFLQVNRIDLMAAYLRYHQVIHLQTLAISDPARYLEQVGDRPDSSVEQARGRDALLRATWGRHPNYTYVEASQRLEGKVESVRRLIAEGRPTGPAVPS